MTKRWNLSDDEAALIERRREVNKIFENGRNEALRECLELAEKVMCNEMTGQQLFAAIQEKLG